MPAAQPIWTDDPRHYGALALCSALGDLEDPNPAYRIQAMPDNDDSPEAAAETLAPPTDREAKTNPENEQPEPRQAMNPPPKRESYFEEAARDFAASLVEMRATRREISDGFRNQGDKIDAGNRENAQNYSLLRQEFVNFRTLFEAKDRDQDAKLVAVTSELASIRSELVAVRAQLETQKQDLVAVNAVIDELEKRWDQKNAGTSQSPSPAEP